MAVLPLTALANAVGTDLGHAPWVEITQDRIDTFGGATEDLQWIHVDAARAAAGPFGATVAHGYLTLSLVSEFLSGFLEVTGTEMAINYGLDRVRFPAPVRVGSRIRGRGSLLSADPVAGGVQTKVKIVVEVEGQEKPACIAEVLTRFLAASPYDVPEPEPR